MSSNAVVRLPDGRSLGYALWGPDHGAPVFLLHGTPGSRLMRHLHGEYDRQRLRAIRYDRPGYGLSTRRPGRRVADAAADVGALADHLGLDRFAVCGVSGGGPSALAAAAAMPDRVSRCATIVGIGPSDADLDFYAGMSEEAQAEWACAREGERYLAGSYYQDCVAWAAALATSEDLDPVKARMLSEAFTEGLLTPDGMVDDYAAVLQPWGFDLDSVVCPTRVMFATEDTSVPPGHGHWLVAHLPNATAWEVPGGHLGPRDEQEEELLGWLANG